MIEKKEDRVDYQHPAYEKNTPKRDLFRAVMDGTDGIRAGGKTYLPQYPAEEPVNYKARLDSATIDSIVANGVDSMCGQVFAEPIDVSKVAKGLTAYLENIDNEGNNFDVFAQDAFKAAFDGHAVILVDAPAVEAPLKSEGDVKRQGVRPYMKLYRAASVINWRYIVDPASKIKRLSLLVLREITAEPAGKFGCVNVTRYRVYRHEPGAMVTQELWREKEKGASGEKEFELEMPPFTMPKLTGIPVGVIGELDCEPWLLNEARMEVRAYQKESSFDAIEYLSVPIAIFKGRPAEMIGKAMEFGAGVCVDVDTEGDAFYMQIDSAGHTSLKDTINAIKKEIGAKLDAVVEETQPMGRTATEVVAEDAKTQARLISWTNQLKDALEVALQYMGQFAGLGDDAGSEIVLRTAWAISKERAEEMRERDLTLVTEGDDR